MKIKPGRKILNLHNLVFFKFLLDILQSKIFPKNVLGTFREFLLPLCNCRNAGMKMDNIW